MEDIQNDLDLIRTALARFISQTPAKVEAEATTAPTAAAAPTFDDAREEFPQEGEAADTTQTQQQQQRAGATSSAGDAAAEQAKVLAASEAARARLEAELASRDAALRQCVHAQHA
ncbi:hypothetical protein DQ04_02151100, partial [Trypanosoma grayi]|uniref:hypothetical protein n=1 Tax=Trypanosoma grayi TaxID=71804 RepID=UPI0004F48B48